jgi:Fungal fucose-specific lectin
MRLESGSNTITELRYNGKDWSKLTLPVTDALSGTGLAAVTYYTAPDVRHIRLYYQADDLSLRDIGYSGSTWAPGQYLVLKILV